MSLRALRLRRLLRQPQERGKIIENQTSLIAAYNLYIFRVVSPIILIAIFLGRILCIINDATLFPLPVIHDGCLPSLLKHTAGISSGNSILGAKKTLFPGCVFLKFGVEVAPAQHAIISTPLFFHSNHRLSPSMRIYAFVAAYMDK